MNSLKAILFIILLILAGCVTLKKASSSYIELQRTPCFGLCPDYKVTVFSTGKVIFRGGGHIVEKTKKVDKISRAEVNNLFEQAKKLNFYSLPKNIDEECASWMSDKPGTRITVKKSGKRHKVRERECAIITDFFLSSYEIRVEQGNLTQSELDSILVRNEQAKKYLSQFHNFANTIDSIATSKKWVE